MFMRKEYRLVYVEVVVECGVLFATNQASWIYRTFLPDRDSAATPEILHRGHVILNPISDTPTDTGPQPAAANRVVHHHDLDNNVRGVVVTVYVCIPNSAGLIIQPALQPTSIFWIRRTKSLVITTGPTVAQIFSVGALPTSPLAWPFPRRVQEDMADQLLDQLRDAVDGQIDFEGQKLVELVATALLLVSGALAFIVGYVLEDIKLVGYIGFAGAALTFVVAMPPWPFYNKHPVRWYEAPEKGPGPSSEK
jgi:signal peptidase complex subunit 1